MNEGDIDRYSKLQAINLGHTETNFIRRLIPKRQFTINTEENCISITIGTFSQIIFGIGLVFLCAWVTFSTSIILSQYLSKSTTNAASNMNASSSKNYTSKEAALVEKINILEQQVAAAIKLSEIASENSIRIETELANAASSGNHKTFSSSQLREVDMATTSHGNRLIDETETELLLSAFEIAINDRNTLRKELEDQKTINTKLIEEANFRRERTRRKSVQIADAVLMAADSLDEFYNNFDLDPTQIIKDIQSDYSGAGGVTNYLEELSIYESEETDFHISDLQNIILAIDKLNTSRLAYLSLPLGNPVKAPSRFTSGYGKRKHPVTGRRDFHAGVDFAAPIGTNIYAMAGGIVTYAGRKGNYGKTVIIKHPNGIETLYAHLSNIRVKSNEYVLRNHHLGDMGSTGLSTGSHLHYEVRIKKQPVNPMKFIKAK